MVMLLLQVPRTNDKKELAAEQMFASLHGLLIFPPQKLFQSARTGCAISFEIAVLDKRIGFYVCVPQYPERLRRRADLCPVSRACRLRKSLIFLTGARHG